MEKMIQTVKVQYWIDDHEASIEVGTNSNLDRAKVISGRKGLKQGME